jgi:peptidoglycan hydrolase FlgJ
MTNNISSLPPAFSGTAAGTKSKDSPEKIEGAAQQFEALMIGQLLKTAREAGSSGWMGTGEDETGQISMDMAEQQLAMTMAKQGGFGLTKTITRDLEQGSTLKTR